MEGAEESGSKDMEFYLKSLKERIGKNVKKLFVLDSGIGNYETLWITNSLRGCISGKLNIKVSK